VGSFWEAGAQFWEASEKFLGSKWEVLPVLKAFGTKQNFPHTH